MLSLGSLACLSSWLLAGKEVVGAQKAHLEVGFIGFVVWVEGGGFNV